jgi:glutamine amidotransferase
MSHIKKSRIDNAIQEALVNPKNRILGICLGMQLLAESSEEGIFEPGLGLIKGISKKISDSNEIKVPHVGFNSISQTQDSQLLKDIPPDYNFYFLHSYALVPENTPSTVATVKYGQLITSVIEHNNQVYGTQFHPEKSQKTGLKVISNFLKI